MKRFNFSRWKMLMQRWGLAEHGPLFEMLQDSYRKEERYYHTESHVDDCLGHLDRLRADLQYPDEVELAIWFHDAVYDPFRQDNELKSAQWVQAFLQSQQANPEKTERVYQLIVATRHGDAGSQSEVNASCPDTNGILDIDLAILGAPSEQYRTYEQAIRSEYREVPVGIYCQKRAELLQTLLKADAIYRTNLFRTEREAQARDNLSWAFESLSAGRIPE